jgi:hypothetical protein
VAPAGVHVPLPEQTGSSWRVAPVHDGVPQDSPSRPCVQPLEPLQVPVLPQGKLAGHWPAGAVVPAAIGVQVPGVVPLQVWQVPQAALPQQTPSTQAALVHSFAPPQGVPFAFLATQVPGVLALPVQ